MTFISFRRELLDQKLATCQLWTSSKEGDILDVGGVKKRRGKFQIPEHLKSKWKTLNNNPDTNPDILCQLPFITAADNNFADILMTEVIEYIYRPEILISECHRVLAPDGYMAISFPFLSPLHGDKDWDCFRITPTYFEKLIQGKFDVVEKSGMGGPLLVFFDALKGEWVTHGKKIWWQKILWKIIGLSSPFLITLDSFFFPRPWASSTGHWYLLRKSF